MPVFSKVLNASFNLARNSPKIINTGNGLMVNQLKSQLFQVQTRGSHGRTMFIRPGKFYTKKFADIIHFHLVIGALPILLFVGYQNFFVGQAALTDIPEGYEPRYWEYIRHPVKRFLARYFYEIPERAYERALHDLYEESSKAKMRALQRKVENLMMERQDYKGWFYAPVQREPFDRKEHTLNAGGRHGYENPATKQ